MRPSFAGAAQWWKQCTPTQQAGWNDYAAATPLPSPGGGSHFVSGFAMFCRTNSYWCQIANWSSSFPSPIPLQIVFDAPTDFDLGVPVSAITEARIGVFEAELFGDYLAPTPDAAAWLLYAGRLVNESREAYHAPFQLALPRGESASASSWHFIVGDFSRPDEWWSAILPAPFQFQALRLIMLYDDGRLSLPYEQIVQWIPL